MMGPVFFFEFDGVWLAWVVRYGAVTRLISEMKISQMEVKIMEDCQRSEGAALLTQQPLESAQGERSSTTRILLCESGQGGRTEQEGDEGER
jgi:hypothetical protein